MGHPLPSNLNTKLNNALYLRVYFFKSVSGGVFLVLALLAKTIFPEQKKMERSPDMDYRLKRWWKNSSAAHLAECVYHVQRLSPECRGLDLIPGGFVFVGKGAISGNS